MIYVQLHNRTLDVHYRGYDSVEFLGEAAYFCPNVPSGWLQGIPGSIFLTRLLNPT